MKGLEHSHLPGMQLTSFECNEDNEVEPYDSAGKQHVATCRENVYLGGLIEQYRST